LAAPLVKYDLLLARRSFADAFATWRDRLLLALVLTFALLWLGDAATRAVPSLPPQAAMLALLAAPATYAWTAAALRRLAWFRETSVLASEALVPRARATYLACAQLPLLAIVVPVVLVVGAWTGEPLRPALIAFLSYAGGLALAAATDGRSAATGGTGLLEKAVRRRRGALPALLALLAPLTFGAEQPFRAAVYLVAGTALATLGGCWLAAGQPPGVQFAAALAPSVLLLVATARNAPEIVGLLAFAGYRARSVALFVCALPAANFAAVALALLLARPQSWTGMLASLLVLHLVAALIATARAWLSPGRQGRSVDLQVQLEMLALVLIANLFAPLVPIAVAWRLWLLRRHYSRLLWIHA
jgi:hypothetical protein